MEHNWFVKSKVVLIYAVCAIHWTVGPSEEGNDLSERARLINAIAREHRVVSLIVMRLPVPVPVPESLA